MAEKHNGYGIKAGFLMCLVCVLAQIGQVTGEILLRDPLGDDLCERQHVDGMGGALDGCAASR